MEQAEQAALTIEEKVQLLLSVGEECVTEAEIRNLVAKKPNFILYDGFEPSGRMHIAQGVFKAMNVNKCTQAGGMFTFWVADWFALMNDKQGGDLDKIQTVGKYLIEVWKAVGMDTSRVKFLWSSDEINSHADEYWSRALDITRLFGINRITKCCTIMGRKEGGLTAAQILYPIMQCTDVFFLKADICQLGIDQRKVNMLAREYCEAAGIKLKPVILSHHMLYGLLKGQAKMSKSNPMSAVFMEDTLEDITMKVNQAHCPLTADDNDVDAGLEEGTTLVEDKLKNPCIDYVKHIIFSSPKATFVTNLKTFHSAAEVEAAFFGGELSEQDLKQALIVAINKLVEPVREHFRTNEEAKNLLKTIAGFTNETKPTTLRRLKLDKKTDLPSWVVFAPIASPVIKVQSLLSIIQQLEAAPKDQYEIILLLPDYSSFALNSCKGEKKIIAAIYTVIVESLKSIRPELMQSVRVIMQSEWVLSNPNDYWISVINVGRKLTLDRVRLVNESLATAGHVITSLMHVACVLGTDAAVLCSTAEYAEFHKLALDYFSLDGVANQVKLPEIKILEVTDLKLKVPTEGFDDPDLELLLLDASADTSRKIKKAFCEPQNIDFNPPLLLISLLGFKNGPFTVARKEENGGNASYTTIEEVQKDFQSGALHPGDIKPIVTKMVNDYLDLGRNSWKADAMKKAINDIKQFLKKQNK